MRKIIALVLTGAFAIGLVGISSAGEETQQAVFKVSPKKLDKKKPQNIKLFIDIITPDDPALGQPPSAERTVVDWPKQFKFNLKSAPTCKTDVNGLINAPTVADAKKACGNGSAVSDDKGSSAIVRTTLPPPFAVIDVDVVAFNAKGKSLYLYAKPTGANAQVPANVLVGKLKKYSQVKGVKRPKGPFKQSLDVEIPKLAAGAIADFRVTIPRSKYVQAKCKPKKMTVQATTVFNTGSVKQSTDDHSVTCKPKASKKKGGKKGKK